MLLSLMARVWASTVWAAATRPEVGCCFTVKLAWPLRKDDTFRTLRLFFVEQVDDTCRTLPLSFSSSLRSCCVLFSWLGT